MQRPLLSAGLTLAGAVVGFLIWRRPLPQLGTAYERPAKDWLAFAVAGTAATIGWFVSEVHWAGWFMLAGTIVMFYAVGRGIRYRKTGEPPTKRSR